MKKTVYLFVTLLALLFQACSEKKEPDSSSPSLSDPAVSVLSPDEQEQKLKNVGNSAIGQFSSTDFKSLWLLVDNCYGKFKSYSFDSFEDLADIDHYLGSMSKALQAIPDGDVVEISTACHVFSIDKLKGIYIADDVNKKWNRTDSEAKTVRVIFKDKQGDDCELKIVASGREFNFIGYWPESEYKYVQNTYYDEYSYQTYSWWSHQYIGESWHPAEAVIPEFVTVTLTENGYEHLRAEYSFDMAKNQYFKYSSNTTIATMKFIGSADIEKTSMKASYEVLQNGTQILSASANVPSCLLLAKNDTESYEAYGDKYKEEYENGENFVNVAYANVDIMNKVQVKATWTKPVKMFRKLNEADEKYSEMFKYDGSDNYIYYRGRREYCTDVANILNSYLDCGIYYSSDILQSKLSWVVTSHQWTKSIYHNLNYSPWYYYTYVDITEYDYTPKIYFPSTGVSMAFGDYFTEKMYSGMLTKIEDLCNSYIIIADYLDIDPIDLD